MTTIPASTSAPLTNNRPELGNMRYKAERRQFAGLLMLTGFCAVIQPLANIASGVGTSGPLVTDAGEVKFWQFVGACCLFAIGVSSVLVGYMEFIHDWGEISHSGMLIVLTQSAFIYYISDMAEIGLNAVKEAPQFFLVFPDSDQGEANANAINQEEVNFMGAIGITGVFAYGFSFVGAIAFMQFSLYAFRSGNPHHRNASYFQSRLTLYTFFLFLSGLCQILLGSFATELTSSDGRIEGGAIRVAMFVVHFPYLTIALGIVQFINGFWGFVRSFGVFVGDESDNAFQYSMAFQFVITLTCQFIVQISLLPEALLAPTIPSFAALSLGIHLMPAFLEYKMRTTPKEIYDDYYFSTASDEAVAERQPMIKKAVPTKRPLELRKIYVVERDAVVGIDEVDFYDGPNGEDGEAAQRWI